MITTSQPEYYIFNRGQAFRKSFFSMPDMYFGEMVIVYVSFHLPDNWESGSMHYANQLMHDKKNVWASAWSNFRQTALKSDGAWIADKSLDAWSTGADSWSTGPAVVKERAGPSDGQKSFMGVFRFLDAAAARKFVASVQDPPSTLESDYGVNSLRKVAARGMSVEAVNMQYQSA